MKKLMYLMVILMVLIMTGCQQTPDDVKSEAQKYNDEETKQEIDLEDENSYEESVGKTAVKNIIDCENPATYSDEIWTFPDDISATVPDKVSILHMQLSKNLANSDNTKELLDSAWPDNNREVNKITNCNYEGYGFDGNSSEAQMGLFNNGFSYIIRAGYASLENVRTKIYHADLGIDQSVITLKNKELNLSEAIKKTEDWCNEQWNKIEPDYCYKVKTVYQDDDNGLLSFDVCKYYQGLPFDDITFTDENHPETIYQRNILEIKMDTEMQIVYFRNNEGAFQVINQENYDKVISLNDAISIVKEKMSNSHSYQIKDINIKYVITSDYTEGEEQLDDGSYIHFDECGALSTARPNWSFIIDEDKDIKSGPWRRKFINVDMISGEVYFQNTLMNYVG